MDVAELAHDWEAALDLPAAWRKRGGAKASPALFPFFLFGAIAEDCSGTSGGRSLLPRGGTSTSTWDSSPAVWRSAVGGSGGVAVGVVRSESKQAASNTGVEEATMASSAGTGDSANRSKATLWWGRRGGGAGWKGEMSFTSNHFPDEVHSKYRQVWSLVGLTWCALHKLG